jgi:hypothetical protein
MNPSTKNWCDGWSIAMHLVGFETIGSTLRMERHLVTRSIRRCLASFLGSRNAGTGMEKVTV